MLLKYLIGGLSFLATVLFGLFYRERAARTKDKLKAVRKARKVESKATEALTQGLNRESESVKKPRRGRDHFAK